jgi:hypothetical protein
MVRIGHRGPSLSKAAARAARLDPGCNAGVPFPFEQLPLLTRGVPTEALLGQTLRPFGLRPLERRKTTTNRFSVDAELLGDVDLVLARANAPRDPLDLSLGQLRSRSHTTSVRPGDISWDISGRSIAPAQSGAKPVDKPKNHAGEPNEGNPKSRASGRSSEPAGAVRHALTLAAVACQYLVVAVWVLKVA